MKILAIGDLVGENGLAKLKKIWIIYRKLKI